MLIDDFEERYRLGVDEMDETHREFVALINRLDTADKASFIEQFPLLTEHTQMHFDNENRLMRNTGFPAIDEHTDEHQRILGELRRLGDRVEDGSITMARAYVREQLPQWFNLHAVTMDSALAAHLTCRAQPANIDSVGLQ